MTKNKPIRNYKDHIKRSEIMPGQYVLADGYLLITLRKKYGEHSQHYLGVAHLVAEHGLHALDAEHIYKENIAPRIKEGTIEELAPEEKEKIEAIINAAVQERGRKGLSNIIDLSALFTKIKPKQGEQ